MHTSDQGQHVKRPATDTKPAWDQTALRDPHRQADKPQRVSAMFDAIAPTYELVNRVASLGGDARWRRRAVAAARVRPTDVVLDICCGTGDMLREFGAQQPRPRMMIGVDFAAGMLSCGDFDVAGVEVHVLHADAQRLPLRAESVDVVTCAFGVRNFGDLGAGLAEMQRVLRPGGRAIILEFTLPRTPVWRSVYRFYCEHMLPILARWISRDRSGAYRYLPRSIKTFEPAAALLARLEQVGLVEARVESLNWGGVGLYQAVKPAR